MCRIVLDCICGDLGDLVSLDGLGFLVALAVLVRHVKQTGAAVASSRFRFELAISERKTAISCSSF